MKIQECYQKIKCRQILSSRGTPTTEIDLHTSFGVFRSSCPSGASTGKKEAKVILDKNSDEYNGKSVKKAIFNLKNIVIPRIGDLNETEIHDQSKIDNFLIHLDGTPNMSRIGANIVLPLSLSFCRAGAVSLNLSLREYISRMALYKNKMPFPHFNVLNGGSHAGTNFPFQEIMVSFFEPEFSKNLESGVKFYESLKSVISTKYGNNSTNVGDEGGFVPPVETLEDALDLIMTAYSQSNLQNMKIALDCAANEFYSQEKYTIYQKTQNSNKKVSLSGTELQQYYHQILKKYPLIYSLEDPFAETDTSSWISFTNQVGSSIQIVADDLTVTNPDLVEKAAQNKMCNTLLVKPNQIGTVTQTLKAVQIARQNNMKIMVSHRSGETEDTFISDFSVGIGAEYIKAGAPNRGERTCKYNQLLRIEESLKKKSK
ncbi:enolase [Hamiltosporidium tvaerminnensis]|uniref:phosphopyruvate hydratase n=2 Tax=Hamiltosporidium TaxID=1176354 RepID=A0A4Q9LED7_9MICR|nr:hypothetical protein LUQ84_003238 [Hamiltosporidium tvaerminnensis]TBU02596.1 enolase [Hamiltosporidium tvaerminnensis]TBU06264.1 enolase [Hamiltosporidium magnivora]TBU07639.1 enolase [Hamiltosporidium magnivora]